MKRNFTHLQLSDLKNNDLRRFTREHRHYCDEQGNTILHLLVIKDNPDLQAIHQALELGASPYIFNKHYNSPLVYAITHAQNGMDKFAQIADALLKQPIAIEEKFLTILLGEAIQYYHSFRDEREAIIGFFASRLCGVDIHGLLNDNDGENNIKYKAHLEELAGTHKNKSSKKVDLEGFYVEHFLPIRIRSMVELFIKVYTEEFNYDQLHTSDFPIKFSEYERRKKLLDTLKAEIKRDVQTYWIHYYGQRITYAYEYNAQKNSFVFKHKLLNQLVHSPHRERWHRALAQGIAQSIFALPLHEAVIIETGWHEHTLYTRIRNIDQDQYELTIHNLGQDGYLPVSSFPWHEKGPDNTVRPYPLGVLTINPDHTTILVEYLFQLLQTIWPRQSRQNAQPIIYRNLSDYIGAQTNILQPVKREALPPLKKQTVGNCTVANHNAARQFLMEPFCHTWIKTWELKVPKENDNFQQYQSFHKILTQLQLPLWHANDTVLPPYLPSRIIKLRDDFYETDKQNKFLSWEKTKPYFEAPQIGEHPDSPPQDFKTWLDTQMNAITPPSHPTYVLLGEPGSGKSSCLKFYADLQWEALNQAENAALIYIPLFISISSLNPKDTELPLEKWFTARECGNNLPFLQNDYRFLFLLDGYDEAEPDTRAWVKNHLISQLSGWRGFTLLSSRSYLEQELSHLPKVYLAKFNSWQIENYIKRHEKEKNVAENSIKQQLQQSPVWHLLDNPLLLYMVLDIVTQSASAAALPVNRYDIYQHCIEAWIRRELFKRTDSQSGHLKEVHSMLKAVAMDPNHPNFVAMLLDFAACIAFIQYNTNQPAKLPDCYNVCCKRVKLFFPKSGLAEEGSLIKTLLSALPLIEYQQTYQFIHPSFYDFFLAHYLATLYLNPDELQALQAITGNNPLNQLPLLWQDKPGVIQFLAERVHNNPADEARWFRIVKYSRKEESKNPWLVKKPALEETSHQQYLAWKQQSHQQNPPSLSEAWQHWKNRQNKIKAVAANAITILNYAGVAFSDEDLTDVRIKEANLSQAIMHNTQLAHANVQGVQLRQSYLRGTNFRAAKMANVQFGELAYLETDSVVNCLAYSPDGKHIAVGCNNGAVYIFNWESREKQILSNTPENSHITCLAWHPSGEQLAFASQNKIYLYDIRQQRIMRILEGKHTAEISCLAYRPTPFPLQLASGGKDNLILIWDLLQNKVMTRLEKHTHWVTCLSYSPDGSQLASGSRDGAILLWNANIHQALMEELPPFRPAEQKAILSLTYSPNGAQLAATGSEGKIIFWDSATRQTLLILIGQAPITCLAWRQDDLQLAAANERNILLWSLSHEHYMGTLTGHQKEIKAIAYHPAQTVVGPLASTGKDKMIRLWQPPATITEMPRATLPLQIHTPSLEYVSEQNLLAFRKNDNTLALWNRRSKMIIKTLSPIPSWISSFAFRPGFPQLVIACNADARGDSSRIQLWDIQTGQVVEEIPEHYPAISCLAWHPSGKQLALGCQDGAVRLYNFQEGKKLCVLPGHSGTTNCLTYSPSGNLVASGGNDDVVNVWTVEGKLFSKWKAAEERRWKITREPPLRFISYLVFHPSLSQLAIGSIEGYIYLWNLETGEKKILNFPIKQPRIIYLAYIRQGKYLLACDGKGNMSIWEINETIKAVNLKRSYPFFPVKNIVYDEDQAALFTLDYNNDISYWLLPEANQPIPVFKPRLQWTSHLMLDMKNMNVTRATGLSIPVQQLLQQRGAKGVHCN